MVKLLGGRAAAAVIGLFMFAVGSSAAAQDMKALGDIPAAVKATDSVKAEGASVASKAAPALADGLVVPVI